MISKDLIGKSLDYAIWKCSNKSSKAISRGSNVSIETNDKGYSLTYSDGTRLSFDEENNLDILSIDGVDYEYRKENVYNDFNYQTDELKNHEGIQFQMKELGWGSDEVVDVVDYDFENAYDFVKVYADNFSTHLGISLNKILNDKYRKIKLNNKPSSNVNIVHFKKSHDFWVELEKTMNIDYMDYVGVRIQPRLYESDTIDKLSYRNKHHTSMSLGGDMSTLLREFGNTEFSPHQRENSTYLRDVTDNPDDKGDWRIFTTIKKGSGVTGLFLGNVLKNRASRPTDNEWESELNLAPNTKFTRDLIDVENHIIIQHIEV